MQCPSSPPEATKWSNAMSSGACAANCRAPGSWLSQDQIPVPDWIDWPEPNLDYPAGTRPFLGLHSHSFSHPGLAPCQNALDLPLFLDI